MEQNQVPVLMLTVLDQGHQYISATLAGLSAALVLARACRSVLVFVPAAFSDPGEVAVVTHLHGWGALVESTVALRRSALFAALVIGAAGGVGRSDLSLGATRPRSTRGHRHPGP